jgi:hypothetical protein
MFDSKQDWKRTELDPTARQAFVRKAKADRFAWTAAELFSEGKHADATAIALQGIALTGEDHFSALCQRYATSVFKLPPLAATEFLKGILPREQETSS